MAFQLTPEADLCSWFRTLLQGLAPIRSSKDLLSFWEIDPELKMFQKKIYKIQDLLNNAEQRSQEICVSNWMDNLRELLYDMEDFVDEMNIERVRMEQKVAIRNQSDPSHHVAGRITFWDNIADNSPQQYEIKKRLAVVLARLDDVVMEANELELKPARVGGGSVSSVEVRVDEDNVGASVDESDVYGREKDKDRIIEQLLDSNDSSRKNYAVISIVGMGGLGKTTLAQLIFHDQRIRDNFGTRSWACVSDVFDFNRVVKELIEYATQENVSNMATSALCLRLETTVQDKKILIVLDDVWEAKAWDRLKASFTRCSSGSKILVTTRDKNVGDAISNKEPYELGFLEDEHCWNLFEEKAFAFGGVIDGSLEKIGRGIVKKCRGIPLAVKVIGSSLRFASEEMWERALDSELWQSVDKAKEVIFPALKLSYHYLPSPLKRSFGYLSLFPTDFELSQQQVVRLWIAEGLVESRADMLLEDIGNDYYHELQRRCLIQKDDKMHDLVLSLARYVVSSKFSHSCAANGSTGLSMHVGSIRHLSLTGDDHLDLNAFEESKHLRTFLSFTGQGLHKIPEWSLLLRVLDLGGNALVELPDFIGSLKHLRHLNLFSSQKLKELPDSICKLHHLQALNLYLCSGIHGLPSDIGNLGSLRYLCLSGTFVSVLPSSIAQLAGLIELDLHHCEYLTCIPENIGSLQNLRTLNLHATPIVSLPDSISKLQKLQVLDLSFCRSLFNLPDKIGCLGGLRMLNLQSTPLSHLPKSIGKLQNLRSLNVLRYFDSKQPTQLSEDICNLSSLEDLVFDSTCVRLPQGIGKLRNLKRLPLFSVGKEAGRGIEELKDMNKLEGSLPIIQLEKVESVEKALSANLKSKVYINELFLQWRSSPGTPSASDHEDNDTKSGDNGKSEMDEKVLDALEPHPKGLKWLSLLNYRGGRTPKWMSDLRLPSLKELRMEGLVWMERVMDIELPSLESLEIENCPELRVVSMGLPNLKTLLITRCQELKALCMSPSLIIQDCSSASDHRSCSRMELPQLVEIRMKHCPSLRVAICMTMPKLERLFLDDFGELMGFFTDNVLEGGPSSNIEIKNYKGRWLPLPAEDDEDKAAGSTSFFPNVGRLQIENCPNLAVLPKALHTIAPLRTLDIINCPQLASFPELPPKLEYLHIKSCTNLQHLPTSLGDLNYLKELRMEGLVCMERVMDIELPSLESLKIKNCPELRVVSMGLPNLKKLLITRCQELKALCMSPSLFIQDCSSASDHRSYSRMELPQLVEIRMKHCPSLRVANCMTMPKLERLFLDDFGELMGFFTDNVLEGGPSSNIEIKNYKGRWLPLPAEDDEDKAAGSASFFPNVGRRQIINCPNLAVLPNALHTIAPLRTLDIINCPQLASFPELPPKLEYLHIKSCTNLQHLPTSLGDLNYLKELRMEGLVCMERVMDIELPSLESLKIKNCPELRVVSMGLPNLKKLRITRCQELKALCMSPSLIIQDCSSISDHRSYSRMELPQLVEIRMKHCPSLRVAICMTMPKLERLFLDDCGELMGFFTDNVLEGGPSSNIEIKNYKGRWLPLPAEDDEDKAAGSTSFFPNVGRRQIINCPNLAVLPNALHTFTSLRTMDIIHCPQLASFPELPPKLEYLHIKSCTNLQHLPTSLGDLNYLMKLRMEGLVCMERVMDIELPSLVSLKIENCPELRVVSMGLPNLKKLRITRCQELKALCMSPSLIIQDCSSISDHRSYSRMELPQLVKIRMKRCPSLRVAICMTMPELEGLFMDDCGEFTLMGFTDNVLEGGPSSDIEIKNYKGRWLPLPAEDDEDKAAGSTLFLPNVGRLHIQNCPNLAVLPKALHTIASLRTLDIINCPQLASFPEFPPMLERLDIKSCTNLLHLPTSLGDLTYLRLILITDCPRLEARPEDRLPPNLEGMHFFDCPQIEGQLKREERKDWLDRSTFA